MHIPKSIPEDFFILHSLAGTFYNQKTKNLIGLFIFGMKFPYIK